MIFKEKYLKNILTSTFQLSLAKSLGFVSMFLDKEKEWELYLVLHPLERVQHRGCDWNANLASFAVGLPILDF